MRVWDAGLGCRPAGHPAVTPQRPHNRWGGVSSLSPSLLRPRGSLRSGQRRGLGGGGTRRTPAPRSRPSPLSTTARGAACARGPAPAPPAGPGRGGPASPRPPSPRPSPALTISALPAAWPRPCRLHAAGRAGGHRALTSGPRASVARQRRAGGDVTAGTPAPNPDPSRPSAPCLEWGRAAAPRWVPMALLSVPTCPSHRLSPTVLAATRCVPTQCSTSGPCSPHSVSPSHGPRGPLWSHVGSPWSPMASHWVPMGITQCRPHKVPMSPLLVPMAESGRDPIGLCTSLSLSPAHGPRGPSQVLTVPTAPRWLPMAPHALPLGPCGAHTVPPAQGPCGPSQPLTVPMTPRWVPMASHWVPHIPTLGPRGLCSVSPNVLSTESPWSPLVLTATRWVPTVPTASHWVPAVLTQCSQHRVPMVPHGPMLSPLGPDSMTPLRGPPGSSWSLPVSLAPHWVPMVST